MVDADGSVQFVDLIGLLLSVATNAWLLFVATPRIGRTRTICWAIVAISGAFLVPMVVIFGMGGIGFRPPTWFDDRLFQLVFTFVTLALLSLMNALFGAMVEALTRFHERHNAANAHRFPLRFVIANRALLEIGFTCLWWSGSVLMFYGIWSDLHI
jgi:hypothetical protein